MNHTQDPSVMADNTNLPPPTLYLVDCNGLSVTFDKPMAEFPHARPLWSEEAVRALLARGSAAAPAASPVVDELATLIRMLVHALRKAAPGNALAERAMDYLKRHALTGNILRDSPAVEGAWQKFCEEVGAPAAPASSEAVPLARSRVGRVYLAGPMTGIADYNFPAFNAAAARLRAVGFDVVNPADHGVVEGAEPVGISASERVPVECGNTPYDEGPFTLAPPAPQPPNANCPIKCNSMEQCSGACDFMEAAPQPAVTDMEMLEIWERQSEARFYDPDEKRAVVRFGRTVARRAAASTQGGGNA